MFSVSNYGSGVRNLAAELCMRDGCHDALKIGQPHWTSLPVVAAVPVTFVDPLSGVFAFPAIRCLVLLEGSSMSPPV